MQIFEKWMTKISHKHLFCDWMKVKYLPTLGGGALAFRQNWKKQAAVVVVLGRRKIWTTGESSNVVGVSALPGWDRVNWFFWGGHGPPQCQQPCGGRVWVFTSRDKSQSPCLAVLGLHWLYYNNNMVLKVIYSKYYEHLAHILAHEIGFRPDGVWCAVKG